MAVQAKASQPVDVASLTELDSSHGHDGSVWSLRFALGLLLVAVIAAGFAVAFRTALTLLTHWVSSSSDVVSAMKGAPIWARVALPATGGLLAGLLGLFVQRAQVGQGVGAQRFMRLLNFGEYCFQRPALKLPWRPALGGTIAGSIIAVLPEVAGNGYEPLNALLDGRLAVGFVVVALFGKCAATTASVSSGSPGGVFTPTLFVGGAMGYLFAHTLSVCGCLVGSAGGYALVGMAAATAATTHAPLMAAVMVFELSGDYAIALPLILATAIATLVSRRLRRDSIYASELRRKGVGWEITMEGRRMLDHESAARGPK